MTRSLPYLPNSGMNDATGSVRPICPSSTSIITAGVVATTLVSDARSKIVSSVIGSGDGCDRAIAVGLRQHDRVAAADDHDGAGQLVRGDRLVDDGVDAREAREIEAGRRGGRGRRARGRLRGGTKDGHGQHARDGQERPTPAWPHSGGF